MTFVDLVVGDAVFIDANTLVYHFGAHPSLGAACKDLLERIARREIDGLTSTHVLSDVAHRIMTLEAMARFGWPSAGIAHRLRQHPTDVQQLSGFRQAIDEIPQFGIQVLPVSLPMVADAASLSQQYGLLSGDALIVAVMHAQGLNKLASHDADFDRVPGLTRYAPA